MTKGLLEKITLLERNVGKDWIKSMTDIKTQEQLEAKATEWGITLTPAEAEEAFTLLSKREDPELSEQELLDVAAGAHFGVPGGNDDDK